MSQSRAPHKDKCLTNKKKDKQPQKSSHDVIQTQVQVAEHTRANTEESGSPEYVGFYIRDNPGELPPQNAPSDPTRANKSVASSVPSDKETMKTKKHSEDLELPAVTSQQSTSKKESSSASVVAEHPIDTEDISSGIGSAESSFAERLETAPLSVTDPGKPIKNIDAQADLATSSGPRRNRSTTPSSVHTEPFPAFVDNGPPYMPITPQYTMQYNELSREALGPYAPRPVNPKDLLPFDFDLMMENIAAQNRNPHEFGTMQGIPQHALDAINALGIPIPSECLLTPEEARNAWKAKIAKSVDKRNSRRIGRGQHEREHAHDEPSSSYQRKRRPNATDEAESEVHTRGRRLTVSHSRPVVEASTTKNRKMQDRKAPNVGRMRHDKSKPEKSSLPEPGTKGTEATASSGELTAKRKKQPETPKDRKDSPGLPRSEVGRGLKRIIPVIPLIPPGSLEKHRHRLRCQKEETKASDTSSQSCKSSQEQNVQTLSAKPASIPPQSDDEVELASTSSGSTRIIGLGTSEPESSSTLRGDAPVFIPSFGDKTSV